MTFKELEKLLISNGWKYKNTRGSHNFYIHSELPGKITIPKHGGDIKKGTLNSILKQAGLK